MSGEARNLFIIPAHSDDAELQGLKNTLARNGYEIRDASIDGSPPNAAMNARRLESSIDQAHVLLVPISPVTRTQPGIDRAIEYAQQQGKRIVGVYVRGGQATDLPASFQKYADALVCCRPSSRVMDAIEGRINTLFMPDCETQFPERDIDRYPCGEPEPE